MNKKTAPQKRNAEATKRRILATAAVVFAEQGFDGCRSHILAERAGVNKAMINYYFKDKLGLYQAAVAQLVTDLKPELIAIRSAKLPVDEKWQRYIEFLFTAFTERPALPRILLREHLDGGQRLERQFAEQVIEFYNTTQTIVSEGRQHGKFSGADAHQIHLSLIGAVTFFVVSQPYRDYVDAQGRPVVRSATLDGYVAHIQRLFGSMLTEQQND